MIGNKSMMGRQQCKKHPKHRQSPGVCSLCLSDKLSKVSNSGTASRSAIIRARARVYYHSSSSSSLSSSYDSSGASSGAASPLHNAHHRRIVSDVRASAAVVGKDGNNNIDNNNRGGLLFSKSKSMAYVEKERLRSDDNRKKNMKKINVKRLWANLFRLGRNEEKRRVNVEDNNDRNIFHPQHHQLQSSSSMVVY